MSTGIGELQDEINDLRKLRKWLIGLFVLFIALPIPIGGAFLYYAERGANRSLSSELDAIAYAFELAIGAQVTSATAPTTNAGRLISGAIGLMNLVFFGFIASIITSSIQIYLKNKKIPRMLTAGKE